MEKPYSKIMIVGANFENKGAQSMLFIAMDEIKKRFPKATIYFAAANKDDLTNYKFEYLFVSKEAKRLALEQNVPVTFCKAVMKDIVKSFIGRSWSSWKFLKLKDAMKNIDLIVDVSGFNIGKKWDAFTHEYYMDNIRLARKMNIPIFLMPQSFGPFDYSEDKKYLLKELEKELPYCRMIFAREKEGYYLLKSTFNLDNVVLSTDMVLQNAGVDLQNIYRIVPELNVPDVKSGAVGIVPNSQCFKHGNKVRIIELYKAVINTLLKEKKEVYIFRHSSEDLEICKEIFSLFNNDTIHFITNDFSCFEYDSFVKKFDFIVCSRYHGNVHAYRNCVPSILLGWAIKYQELAEHLGQEEYSFDITDEKLDSENITSAVEKMCDRYMLESKIIKSHLEIIQKENCFEKAFGK